MTGSHIPFNHGGHVKHPVRRSTSHGRQGGGTHTQEEHFIAAGEGMTPELLSAAGSGTTEGSARPVLQTNSSSRFQAGVRKVIHSNRLRNKHKRYMAEPGLDARRVDLPGLKAPVVVQIADWSANRSEFNLKNNSDFSEWLDNPRPEWSKVRWIHVNGLSWDVLKPLAVTYDLHPLSVEDVLHHSTSSVSSKADYFADSLFVSVVNHRLLGDHQADSAPKDPAVSSKFDRYPVAKTMSNFGTGTNNLQQDDPELFGPDPLGSPVNEEMSEYQKQVLVAFGSGVAAKERVLRSNTLAPDDDDTDDAASVSSMESEAADEKASRWAAAEITRDMRVHVHVEQLSLFLLRDGTVISITQDEGYHRRLSGIFDRLQTREGLLRTSEDASLVLQAILDVVGDDCLHIVETFRQQLTVLEGQVLNRPGMATIRHLHVLSAELLLLKSTLTPVQSLIHSLRFNDEIKSARAQQKSESEIRNSKTNLGYLSLEAKVYLGDVGDHMESVMASLDLFSGLAENLIDFQFNVLNLTSTRFLMALSIMSAIFLPVTFLSSYFGMNFVTFDAIQGSVAYFWYIACPIIVASVIIFGWSYLTEMFTYLKRDARRVYQKRLIKARSRSRRRTGRS